ncbi:nitrogen regulation protein NR(I) [Pleionea mediterranea]|uniref:DNA-binding transcriptional regulator NtrC n=1 Tax=Pleionea mediterranea TaxID=523701 RepID=A0A316FWF3_9GAMM|nr:nitrogen regulation protein NR(I) [Pleionea mediterranea]PWK52889.1 two-component system nitrogen regulation response regulator GlnG [Pleionea mediterranea]
MTEQTPVLVIDDDTSIRWVLTQALSDEGFAVSAAENAQQARELLEQQHFAAVLSDIRMPGDDGLVLLKELKQQYQDLPVIIMTAHSDLESAVNAYEHGAFDYLPKPFDVDQAIELVSRAVQVNQQESAVDDSTIAESLPTIIGEAPAMQEVFRAIGRLSRSNISVLINGASGTGKELVARALHQHSRRSKGPFVALNMAAIPKDLIESELFGHEKGAFTGASSRYLGRFEQAEQGTLFLDEIGDMPLDTQTRLLRVLSDGSFYRVGGTQPVRANVRVVAATHQNLAELVKKGSFREDLFHRINVIRIQLPQLKERLSDIPLLSAQFLAEAAKELETEPKQLTREAERRLMQYSWPGNVRQLENVCRWLMVMSSGREILETDLPPEIKHQTVSSENLDSDQISGTNWQAEFQHQLMQQVQQGDEQALQKVQLELEQMLIDLALTISDGHKQEAAKLLGWGRNTITRKQKKYRV